jgi:D-beta-D-heptose 7-phosphate kinase/D-beta-D-heptose 1-phosphate adenosyltransferase
MGIIVELDGFWEYDDTYLSVVCVSGGYDPIHPGHIGQMQEASNLGDILVAIVNGDSFLERKKGVAFMDLRTRCQIVAAIDYVDYVIPYESENDDVTEVLKFIGPDVFCNGGDVNDHKDTREYAYCRDHGIKCAYDIGPSKEWSSTDILSSYTTRLGLRKHDW